MENLTLETAMLVLEQFDPVALTEKTGRYIYANKQWFAATHVTREDLPRLHPWEVFHDSKVQTVLETRAPLLGQVIDVGDHKGIVNYYPIEKDGEFFGVLIWSIFTAMELAVQFSRRIDQLSRELRMARDQIKNLYGANYSINSIIGDSLPTRRLKQEIASAARTGSTVLIEGETGVGKELVAHSIHALSARSHGRFVRVNCSAIPPELMESEFFGYDVGAFTGAKRGGNKGKFEQAQGGSIFFDEINSLPLTMQPKFLRVLQERELERIGGKDTIPVDVRVIAATNQPLESLITKGLFREDLYYRLNVLHIRVAPLRERIEDVGPIARFLVEKLNSLLHMGVVGIDADALELLGSYNWPGNIRQLQNVLERAMNNCYGDTLTMAHFDFFKPHSPQYARLQPPGPPPLTEPDTKNAPVKGTFWEKQSELESLLQRHGGNKTSAANELGVSRTTLYKRMKKYGIEG
ncbi:MAG: sigma 54-interacting transcriptional regulator [Lachnospiraceae bacterium]|jgi:transcriptional regulator with PAS, ATPase and Fis domain|nr:sigma 54-interacting transcriptional regulator [Lachnospiraceae bacterium]